MIKMYVWELFVLILFIVSGTLFIISWDRISYYVYHNSGYHNKKWGNIWSGIFMCSGVLFIVLIPFIIIITCNNSLLDEMIVGFFTTKM